MKDLTLFKSEGNIFLKKIASKDESKFEISDGFLLDMEEKEARRTIESLRGKNKVIALLARDDEFNRRALETLKINYLISLENNPGKDNLKQRSSGFNHVLAEIAKKNKIDLVVGISTLFSLPVKKRALFISRIIQNVKICRRSKLNLKIVSLAKNEEELLDENQLRSIAYSFGMSSEQAKTSLIL